MPALRESIDTWLKQLPERLEQPSLDPRIKHVGRVVQVSDGVARVAGLPWTRLDELLRFEDGSLGLALQINREEVGCVLLSAEHAVNAGTKVFGTGEVARVPVGPGLLGRVVNATGAPIDNGSSIAAERFMPVGRPAPGIVERGLVHEPLITGITVVDAMVPLGRGQRQLIIGDRKTGKTALAVDTVINQRNSEVICIYALIGQKTSTVEEIIDAVRTHGNIERCIFVVGEATALPGAQWLVPYAACTMAEYFRDNGQHALLVLDDLTKHAIVYRQLSLLLRRPPGREAYPGDVFHIHSQLLERAAKLSKENGGGSLTALPIAETQAGNLSAYIPTNLISITDGQIYCEPKLFYEGQKPAVNVGLSVSRVGGATQAPIIKQLAKNLRLQYAQFLELEVFARFGAMVDDRTKQRIEHGRRIRAILTQPQYRPLDFLEEVALLLAVDKGLLDDLSLSKTAQFQGGLGNWLTQDCARLSSSMATSGSLSEEEQDTLLRSIEAFVDQVSTSAKTETSNE